jgi:hypothetical protein
MARSTIMPVFRQFPREAAQLGIILAGYGELEYELLNCLNAVLGDLDASTRVLFRARGEEQRIQIADALMRWRYDAGGLINPYSEAIADMGYCRQLRNQYAHCHWAETNNQLWFANLQDTAKSLAGQTMVRQYPIDLPLLELQEDYFVYVRDCFSYLDREFRLREGRLSSHIFRLPKKVARPPKHSGAP